LALLFPFTGLVYYFMVSFVDCVHCICMTLPQTKMPLEICNGTFTHIINV